MRTRLPLVSAILALVLCACTAHVAAPRATPSSPRATATASAPATPSPSPSPSRTARGHLRAGSDRSVLPAPVLIADSYNNRLVEVDPHGRVVWTFPRPGDLARGQTFKTPDDAFFTPDGRQIIATQEEDFVVSLIDVATHRIVWRYGTPGVHGSSANHLWNPDDAIVLRDGTVLIADIKNCRLLLVAKGAHVQRRALGTPGRCAHDPPRAFAHPNGAFPMRNGHFIVTEINGAYATEMDLKGNVFTRLRIPGLTYPSDTNEVKPGLFLVADYNTPGTLLEFDASGRTVWRYRPRGVDELANPSLAIPLPNGDVLCNDDRNHRVVVVDPRTDRVVWQYGVTGHAGARAGLLDNPDGVDLAPPFSELVTRASTLGTP